MNSLAEIPVSENEFQGGEWTIGDFDCGMLKFSEMLSSNSSDEHQFFLHVLASKPELFNRLRKSGSIDEMAL